MAKPKKTYQVWALLRTEHGTESWHAVTRKFLTKAPAVKIAAALWLETKVNEEDLDEDDEPGETSLIENFENAQYEGA